MNHPILLDYYREIPQRQEGEKPRPWWKRFQEGMESYRRAVAARYNEGTLEHLLNHGDADVRRAAVTALGMIGSAGVSGALARLLHDEDTTVRKLCEEALWSLWFWAAGPERHEELRRLMRMNLKNEGGESILKGFGDLLKKAPHFAEAYNQRAIVFFRLGRWEEAVADCAAALKLNPYHFGAASGLAQCCLKQRKLRAALRAYRRAHRINPNLEGVPQVIESLERKLGEEGRK